MALRTAGSVLVVFLWSVAVVLGKNGWSVTYTTQSICVLKGSTVEMSCSYTYPSGTVTTTFWFNKNDAEGKPVSLSDDPDYKGRVTYRGDKKNGHTLTVRDLRESDSATYKFRLKKDQTGGRYTGNPGVTLSVTGLQVKVTGRYRYKTLTCSTTCTLTDNPTYIWYKNGHKVKEDTSSLYSDYYSDADSYSCAVKGHEDHHSPAVCKKCWSVTYTHQSICALKGSTVDISCSYTYPSYHEIKRAFWFTKWSGMEAEDLSSVPGYEGHIEYLGDKESDCTLRITDLRLSDSAGYRFRFITSGGKFSGSPVSLTVTDVVLEMDPTSVSEGERVTLTCRTKCTLDPITAYSWYKNGQPIPNRNTYSPVYILFSVSSEDTGRYSCAVEGHEDLPSAEETLTVTYKPKNTSVSVSPSGEIVEGSSVTLTCSSDAKPPVQSYTWWYKKNGGDYQSMTGPQHVFSQIQSSDTGEYYCEAQNELGTERSRTINMDVKYGPKNTSMSVSPSGEIVEGSSVTLTCSSDANPPVDKYTWYKKNVTSPKASGQSYSITNIISEDRGEYYCEAQNGRGSMNSTALMIIVAGKQTSVLSAAVGITVVVLVLILCLSGLMWFRKKSSKSPSVTRDTADDGQGDSSPVYDNISGMAMTSTAAQTAGTDDQDDVHYASVHFSRSKNKEVPLYSTVQLPQPQKQDQDVQYAAVKFNLPSSATQPAATQASEEDPSVLYRTVNKPRTKKT